MTWARAGRAYAKAGNAQAARKALGDATKHLDRAVGGDTPSWSYWVNQVRITSQVGMALFYLGDYAGAKWELATAVEACGDSYPRDRATWLARLATAQLRTGNVEAGCESGRKTVDLLSGQVDSARGLAFLKTFGRELSAYQSTEAARDFATYSADRLG